MASELTVELTTKKERSKPKPWQMAKVTDIIVETPETSTLRIAVPEADPFLPGQYYNIRIPIEGRPRPIQRAYSIGSSPHPDSSIIEVGIRETPGGLVSPVLVRQVAPGDLLEVRGPYGAFTWTQSDGGPVLLIGAGSGVVPLMAMIRYQIAMGTSIPMHLLFSSKSYEFVIYGRELEELSAEYDWLEVSHSFTRDPDDARARYHRRIDAQMLEEIYGEVSARVAYICGPPEVVDLSEEILLRLGMDPDGVRTEKYD